MTGAVASSVAFDLMSMMRGGRTRLRRLERIDGRTVARRKSEGAFDVRAAVLGNHELEDRVSIFLKSTVFLGFDAGLAVERRKRSVERIGEVDDFAGGLGKSPEHSTTNTTAPAAPAAAAVLNSDRRDSIDALTFSMMQALHIVILPWTFRTVKLMSSYSRLALLTILASCWNRLAKPLRL